MKLVIALVIIALLIAAYIRWVAPLATEGNIMIQRDQVIQISYHLLAYRKEHGMFPGNLEELSRYAPGCKLIDRWQTPLRYEKNGDTFVVTSAGTDKKFGTKQDIIARLDVSDSESITLDSPKESDVKYPATKPINAG